MEERSVVFGDNRIVMSNSGSAFKYSRHNGDMLASESIIVTDNDETQVGIFPIMPIKMPKEVAKNVYIKFKAPVIVDQRSISVIYSKIPIEIGIYRQFEDEELLIDAFSLGQPRYSLYGSPEQGVICRYFEAEAEVEDSSLEIKKYEEAKVRIRVTNDIDNVTKISKVIIPVEGVVLEHQNDEVWLPGSIEMKLDTAFGKDIVQVKLSDTYAKRGDKTSTKREKETLLFSMDAGY